MTYGPHYAIDGARPSAPRYSLVTAAQVVTIDDDHWMNGVSVRSYPCDDAQTWASCIASSRGFDETMTKASGSAGSGTLIGEFDPITVYLPETCTARGIVNDADFRSRAVAAFAAREAAALEYEFWTGSLLDTNPHLDAAGATILNSGTTVGLVYGLELLEDAVGASTSAGMIHCTPGLATGWASLGLVSREGTQLVTMLGTIIVPGSGYPGTAPAGGGAATGSETWAIATGMVQVIRSEASVLPATLAEALDRESNEVTYRVERHYLATLDGCFRAAVIIDACQSYCEPLLPV